MKSTSKKTKPEEQDEAAPEIISEEPSNGEEATNETSVNPTLPESKHSEFTIKEIMVQKGCDRERAIHILNNPTPHK